MVSLSTLTVLARSAAGRLTGIAGDTITVALATLAEGIQKAGNVTISANGAVPRTVSVANSGVGSVTLEVSGDITATGDSGIDGDVTVVGYVEAGDLFSLDAISAAGDVALKNNGSTHRITLTGTPTGNRTVTFPDADITIGPSNFIGSYAKAYLQANTAFGAGTTAFCTDIYGINGGVTGVLCYLGSNPLVGWLRFSNDSPI
jgi:hypothetical protein